MKINNTECWNAAIALIKEHKEALLAVAGVFIFLPTMLMAQFIGEPVLTGQEDPNAMIAVYSAFFAENWPAIFLSNLLVSFGGFILYVIFARGNGGTVADSLVTAFKLFIFFILANILSGLLTMAGFLLFIIPGIIVAIRLVFVPMIVADHLEKNPAEAVRKSWQLTKGNALSIFLLLLIVIIVGSITIGVLQLVVGIVTGLVTGGEGWPLIVNLVSSLAGTAFQILLIALIAGIYQKITGHNKKTADVFS